MTHKRYIDCDFDNMIIDIVFGFILNYFQNNVSYHEGVWDLFDNEWYYNKTDKRIWNYIHNYGDDEKDILITIGLSKNYDKYVISSDKGGGHFKDVRSKAFSLGSIVDEITTDVRNIEDSLIKGIEDGFLI